MNKEVTRDNTNLKGSISNMIDFMNDQELQELWLAIYESTNGKSFNHTIKQDTERSKQLWHNLQKIAVKLTALT